MERSAIASLSNDCHWFITIGLCAIINITRWNITIVLIARLIRRIAIRIDSMLMDTRITRAGWIECVVLITEVQLDAVGAMIDR